MEDEIGSLRRDLAKFTDWAKQSHQLNQRNLSTINENFNQLLKLFLSKNGTVSLETLNRTATAKKSGIGVESENRERASSSVSYEAVNDFSDDEDVEESLRIKPISLKMLPLNKKPTDSAIITKRKSSFNEKLNSVTDATLISTDANSTTCSETSINSKSNISSEKGRKKQSPKIEATFTGEKYERCLSDLKRKREESCKKYPHALKLTDSYLEYGAARGWDIRRVKNKLYNDRVIAGRTRKVKVAKRSYLKSGIIGKNPRSTGTLNLSPEQLEANLKALREEHAKSKICPIPDNYFQFGAARGWHLRQVAQKYYNRYRTKCEKYMGS